MSKQPQARTKKALPDTPDWQAARELILSLQNDIMRLQGNQQEDPAPSQYDDTAIGRNLYQLRYDFDRHEHRRNGSAGDSYEGHFKMSYLSGSSVTIGTGYIALRDSTSVATGGTLAISAVNGYHYVLVRVWYNSAWKYDIIDSTGGYPDRITTVTDGGSDFEGYQQVIGILQVSGGVIFKSTLTQIIHDEAVNLIDWTSSGAAIDGGYLFRVTKSAANEVAIASGVVICGPDTLQVSNTTQAISATNGSYYLSIEISYGLTGWESSYNVGTSYPAQTVDTFVKLIAIIVVADNEVGYIAPIHRGGEIINPRIAE